MKDIKKTVLHSLDATESFLTNEYFIMCLAAAISAKAAAAAATKI